MDDEIDFHVVDRVAVLTLNALDRRNALTREMAVELVGLLDSVDLDREIGALVIGGGASFCAGADLGVLGKTGADPTEDTSFRTIEDIYAAFLRLGSVAVPTIAAVRGAAVGAGMNLMLATDLRVVALDARLLSGFGRLRLHPGGGHFHLLNRIAGREVAAGFGLFGKELAGARAAELGMAWTAVDDADVETTALDLARPVARDPELARRMAASFRREVAAGISWDVAVEVERSPQMWTFRRKGNEVDRRS